MEIRQNIVVFTGAGISKESGIPTFRDSNGMWKKYDAILAMHYEQGVLPYRMMSYDGWASHETGKCGRL